MLFAVCASCQPFTKLFRKEFSNERKESRKRDSNLLFEAVKFVEHFQPELVLSKNVADIKEPRFGGVWDNFRKMLEESGYPRYYARHASEYLNIANVPFLWPCSRI
ncbi:MAG: DNA cytosine methyltransferase [Alphaproteobacteria bacterium]|nr:DNA cytosine methyltransferase [Alphaproteobacteria bacterium]